MVRQKKLAFISATLLLSAGFARADTLWVGSADRNALKVEGAKVQQLTDGKLVYTTASGTQTSKPLDQFQQINIDGEASFNAGEIAFAAKDYSTAISSYTSSLQNSATDWVQLRSAMRLTQAGKMQNRYDAQVTGYAALIQQNPKLAADYKPAEPAANTEHLDTALASVNKALDSSKIDASQKSALLGLQLQINQAQGDTAQATATLKQLASLGGATPADIARLKLADAMVAYNAKQYSQVMSDIDQNRATFTEPDQQVDALFLLAQAKYATDGDKADAEALKDLALRYMRVVTFGSKLPNAPHVSESLLQAATIEEKLKEPQAALQLYQQIVREKSFAASTAVAQAKTAIDRLAKESSSSK